MFKFIFVPVLFLFSFCAQAQGCRVNEVTFSAKECVLIENAIKQGNARFTHLPKMFTLVDACEALGGEMDEVHISPQKEMRKRIFITKDAYRCFVKGQARPTYPDRDFLLPPAKI